MKSIYKYILFLYLSLAVLPQMYALQKTFKSLSVSDGMTDLVVNSIYKDSKGFVWFGTNSSLERFDGVRLKKYGLNLPDNNKKRVYALTESPTYGVLCATGGGMFRLDSLDDRFVPFLDKHISVKVNAVTCFSGDTLIIATDEGLFVSNKNGVVSKNLFNTNLFSPDNKLTGITLSGDSSAVWLSSMNGIVRFEPNSGKYKKFVCNTEGLSSSFYNIASIGDYLYLGTMDCGLIRFNVKTHEFDNYVDVGCSVISSLSTDGNDLLYVGTDGNGVHFVSVSQHKVIESYRHISSKRGGIRSNSVYSVLVDRDGLIWIGLYQMGVDYTLYQSGLFGIYKWKEKFTTRDMPVRTIAFNGSQKLIGSRDGLVFIDEKKDIVQSFNMPVLRSNMIISSCYFDGMFYAGTYGGGMYMLNPETLSISDFPESLNDGTFRNGHIFSIRPDYEGNLWVGTSSGLYCFNDGKKVYHFTSSHSKIPDGNVYEIFFDSSKKGWICTENGVCLWEPSVGAIRDNVFPDGFINDAKIRAVYESYDRKLYFFPEKGDVFFTNLFMDEFAFMDNAQIFDNKQMLSAVEDGLGGVFVTTNNGLYRIDSCMNVIPYNFTDGIPDPIFTNCVALRDSSGVFWFGNSKGLVFLDSDRINDLRMYPYRVEITDVFVNGKDAGKNLVRKTSDTYELDLDNSSHNIKVLFSGLIYSDPAYMIYEYSIDKSELWKPLHGVSEISLYDIKGNTSLKIRRAGYPESQVLLYISVTENRTALIVTICILILCCVLVYFLRHRLVKITIGNLKKLMQWLQSGEKQNDIVVAEERTVENVIVDSEETSADDVDCETETIADTNDDKYRNYRLSEEECKRLLKILDKEMSKNKLYTKQTLKIADLAAVAGTSSHALSYVFNQYLQKSYYDYINEFRVEEFKSAIKQEKYSKYTLEALSEHCGFSSRASFFRSFKKVTGITPNEYIKNMKSSVKLGNE